MGPHGRRAAVLALLTLSTAAGWAGCSSFRPHIGKPAGPRADRELPTVTRQGDMDGLRDRAAGVPNQRRVCRATGWGREWIATEYQAASGECPPGPDGKSSWIAVLTRLDAHPVGMTLEVCVDERLPRNWELMRTDERPGNDRCPGAAPAGKSTVRTIRRLR